MAVGRSEAPSLNSLKYSPNVGVTFDTSKVSYSWVYAS